MIIWISGPYGVGKSTLAEAMADKKMPSSSMRRKWATQFGRAIPTVPMVTYLRTIPCGVNSVTYS